MLVKLRAVFFIYLSVACQLIPSTSIANASELHFLELEKLAYECLTRSKIDFCERALVLSEGLQRFSEHKKNYACQSRLLGLGAFFIMKGFDPEGDYKASQEFDQMFALCKEN